MDKVVNFGLGFVTGRPNVCKVINNTYEQLINLKIQIQMLN